MNNFRDDLLKELKGINASEKEAEELLEVAFKVNNLSTIRRSYNFKKAKAKKIASIKTNNSFFIVRACRELLSFKLLNSPSTLLGIARRVNRRVSIPILAAIILLLGTSSIVLAQKSLPGEALYPFKRVTEDVIVTFNPVFKEEVFKRRVEENRVIIEKKKVSDNKKLEDEKKEKKRKDNEENKNTINIEENKNSSESSKKEPERSKKEEEKKQEEKKSENEIKNNKVKGAEDKKIESKEEKEKKDNDKDEKSTKEDYRKNLNYKL